MSITSGADRHGCSRARSGILGRLRPPRADIAAPPWRPELEWIGPEPPAIEPLTAGGPLLVHFFDFAQLNSVRALPYVLSWHERYRRSGLRTIGVHAPRFPFTRPAEAVSRAIERLRISHPVAVDADFRLWRDYGCHGWPSLFLWSRGGALRWYHLGEGDYEETELALREAIDEAGTAPDEWPPTLEPMRPADAPGIRVIGPTPEVFPGGAPDRPWRPSAQEPALRIEYAAGGAYAAVDGAGALRIALDGGPPAELEVAHPGLVELASHPHHQAHALEVEPLGGVQVYALSFASGIPG